MYLWIFIKSLLEFVLFSIQGGGEREYHACETLEAIFSPPKITDSYVAPFFPCPRLTLSPKAELILDYCANIKNK